MKLHLNPAFAQEIVVLESSSTANVQSKNLNSLNPSLLISNSTPLILVSCIMVDSKKSENAVPLHSLKDLPLELSSIFNFKVPIVGANHLKTWLYTLLYSLMANPQSSLKRRCPKFHLLLAPVPTKFFQPLSSSSAH